LDFVRRWGFNIHLVIKLPCGVNIENLINDLRIFSWEASEIFLNYSQILKDAKDKSNILKNNNYADPVTLVDLKVNDLMIRRINEKYKDINWEILSEESVKIAPKKSINNTDWLWVLDPLDGTKDFIQGAKNYAMHLALNYKKRPFLGIVLIPEMNELWISDGSQVWSEKRDGFKTNAAPLKEKNLTEMALVTSKNHSNESLARLINKINFKKVIIMGSIGCKIASILRGESDLYICLSLPGRSSPKDWDFAAPEAILRAAGGAITSLDNKQLIYGGSNFEHGGVIVASNNKNTHKDLCLEIKEIIKKYKIYPL